MKSVNFAVTTEGNKSGKAAKTQGDIPQQWTTNKGESIGPVCYNKYEQKTIKELLHYSHSAAFNPTKATWSKVICKNQFVT